MKRKSKKCSTGHGTGVLQEVTVRSLKREPRLKLGVQMNAREQALRDLHRGTGSNKQKLRSLLANRKGRWPRVERPARSSRRQP